MLKFLTGFGKNINDVMLGGHGCSEYSFFKLIKNFSDTEPIELYDSNKRKVNNNKNINHCWILDLTSNVSTEDIVICDRAYDFLHNNPKIFTARKVFNIIHDYIGIKPQVEYLLKKYTNYFPVFVSETQMNSFAINNSRCNFVYNLFYKPLLDESIQNKKFITYCSAPRKGLSIIYNILQPILHEELKLNICYPCYCDYPKQFSSDKNVIIHKNLQHNEYSSLIARSQYVISPPKFETFGCVFSEAAMLNTNTLYFDTSGAIKEICPDAICLGNHNNLQKIRNNIRSLIMNFKNQKLRLNPNLTEIDIMNKWRDLINE